MAAISAARTVSGTSGCCIAAGILPLPCFPSEVFGTCAEHDVFRRSMSGSIPGGSK
jgi:hypothetical protein